MKKVLVEYETSDGRRYTQTMYVEEFRSFFNNRKEHFKIVFAFIEEDKDFYDAWFWSYRSRKWVHAGAIVKDSNRECATNTPLSRNGEDLTL